jgi:hypothetical protein
MTSLKLLLKNRPALFAATLVLLSLVWVIIGEKPGAALEIAARLKETGEKAEIEPSVTIGLFYASIFCLIMSSLLLATVKWWGRPLDPAPAAAYVPNGGRLFWILIALAMLTGAGLRIHLAKGSLWWDELWNIKHTMVGQYVPDLKHEGQVKFKPVNWERTIWNYKKPTNHPPMAIASRLSNGLWQKLSGNKAGAFSETAIRLPSLLAGLGSIALAGLLLRRWGFASAGIVAAFILAVHPWQLRYGVEARGYSFIVFFTFLACLALTRALASGRWRDWSLFGLAQFFLMWTLPISVWYAGAFALAAIICALVSKTSRQQQISRIVVVNVVAGMAFCTVFLPNILQLLSWGEINDHQYLDLSLTIDALRHLCFGMSQGWPQTPDAAGLPGLSDRPAAVYWLCVILIIAAIAAGVWQLRKNKMALILFALIALSATAFLFVTWKTELYFYNRYLIYLTIPWVSLLAIGLTRLLPRCAAVPVFFVAYLFLVGPQLALLNTRSYQPFREIAEFIKGQPDSKEASILFYGLGGRVFPAYYPEALFADNLKQLDEHLDKKSLYVVYGYHQFTGTNEVNKPGLEKILDPTLFQEIKGIGGIDDMFYLRVLKRL